MRQRCVAAGMASIGVNVNYVFNTLSYTSAQQESILRTLARTGVDTARSDALWEATEPSRGDVLAGGLANAPGTLPKLLAAVPALRGAIDGVAIHPYGTSTEASVLSAVRAARATLVGLGLGSVPLYVTEFGWVTSPPRANHYVPASQRGRSPQRVSPVNASASPTSSPSSSRP